MGLARVAVGRVCLRHGCALRRCAHVCHRGVAMNGIKKTTKKEIVEAVEEACRIATLPDPDRFMTSLNQQLGTLKSLARHLPDDNTKLMPSAR